MRTLAVNCAPLLLYLNVDRKSAAETPSHNIIIGAVQAVCEFSVLVSQQNHSDIFLKTLGDALKQIYQKHCALQ